jgi:hypothetical protein
MILNSCEGEPIEGLTVDLEAGLGADLELVFVRMA